MTRMLTVGTGLLLGFLLGGNVSQIVTVRDMSCGE